MKPAFKTPYTGINDENKVERKERKIGDIIEWMRVPNLIAYLPQEGLENELLQHGTIACRGYDMDYASSKSKRDRVARAEKLANLQTLKPDPNYPFENAADSCNPMVSKTIIQHFTREISMFMKDGCVAKFLVKGDDPDGAKAKKAERCGAFLSYYMLEEMDGWLETHFNALMAKPCAGAVFKKTYWDSAKSKVVSGLMRSNDYTVDYYTKSLKESARGTNTYTLYPYEIEAKIRSGYFVDFDYGEGDAKKSEDSGSGVNNSAGGVGIEDDDNIPHIFLEQSTRIDLDGDGFDEPYVLIIHQQTMQVVQIFANFDPTTVFVRVPALKIDATLAAEIESGLAEEVSDEDRIITLQEHFRETHERYGAINKKKKVFIANIDKLKSVTRMLHLPAVDGGFYGMGAGEMLTSITELINDVTNMLLDAGATANTKGGFITEDIEMIEGDDDEKVEYMMNEFKRVRLEGKSLHDHIFEFSKMEPSVVLYNLRNDLIREGNEEGGATNLMSGELPRGDAPVGTVLALLEQGLQKISAIMLLAYMGTQEELRIIWDLLRKHPPQNAGYSDPNGGWSQMMEKDFDDDGMFDVVPIADKQSITSAHKLMKAQALLAILGQVEGHGGSGNEILRRYLEALAIPEVDAVLPRDAQAPESPDMIKLKQEEDKLSLAGEKVFLDYEIAQRKLEIEQMRGETDMFKQGSEIEVNAARVVDITATAEAREPGDQGYKAQVDRLVNSHQISQKMIGVKSQQVKKLEQENAQLKAKMEGGPNGDVNAGNSDRGLAGQSNANRPATRPGAMAGQSHNQMVRPGGSSNN